MPPSPARAWLVVALLWFVVCSNFLARLMLTTMHGSILASIPMTETQFGLLTSILLCTYGLVSPFAGFLADRFGRSRVIIVSMFTWSTITWLTSYAKSFEQLLILRSLMGLSEACYLPAGLAMVSDYHRAATRSLATGVHQSGMYVGMALAGLGGWLAERRSWHYAFSLVGLAGIAYAALLVLLLRDTPGEGGTSGDLAEAKARFGEGLARLFSRGSFVLVVITWGMLGTISWSVYGWMPLFLQEHFHLGQGIAGLSATFYSNLAAMPGLLAGGIWADRWSRRNHRARVLVATFGLLLAAPSILLTARTGILALAILGVIFYRLFTAFLDSNMMPILCEIIDRRYRATAYGLLNLTGVFGAGLGLYFAGVLRDLKVNLSVVYTVVAGLTALGSGMFFFVRPRMPVAPGGVLAARTLGQKRSH